MLNYHLKRFFNSKSIPFLILLFIAVLGYWQIAFLIHPQKWDAIDCFYPWRFMVSESFQNHILPLWNSYQGVGYPLHADPSSGAWYPFVWLVSVFGSYNIYIFSFEFIFHIFLAGAGMFLLAKKLNINKNIALIMAISYMFSGFFISNSQHFTCIISAAWIPFVFNYYLELNKTKTFYSAVKLALVVFMLCTGGYVVFVIVLAYILLAFYIVFSIESLINKDYVGFRKFSVLNIVTLVLVAIMGIGMIVSTYNVLPYISRGHSVPLEFALLDPFTPNCTISFLMPFVVATSAPFIKADISMCNAYFGILMLVFFIASFFIKKNKIINVFIISGFIALAFSMGKYLPVREFFFHFVPLMNLSRSASIVRLFFIISAIIASGYSLNYFISKGFNLKILKWIIISLMSALFVFFIISAVNISHEKLHLFPHIFIADTNISVWQQISLNSALQILVLAFVLLIFFRFNKNQKKLTTYMIFIVLFDMFISTQLNAAYTVYLDDCNTKEMREHERENFIKDFPIPSSKNIIDNKSLNQRFRPYWRNLSNFSKEISEERFTSFMFINFETLFDNNRDFLDTVLSNPPIYLSDKVFPADSLESFSSKGNFDNKTIFLDEIDYKKINQALKINIEDTAWISEFSPIRIIVKSKTKNPLILTLLQQNYFGWEVFVNGEKSDLLTSNKCFISTLINGGENTIEFKYHPKNVYLSFFISVISFILVVLFLIGYSIKEIRCRKKMI
ncbi:MAG: YfhO family protein [Saprospiraceae bacterium]|nr:YfhO family protein [Saprospiraceae bacterium]